MSRRVTEQDLQQVREFGSDLKRVERLNAMGHRRPCAVLMVFEKYPCSCPAGMPLLLTSPENNQ